MARIVQYISQPIFRLCFWLLYGLEIRGKKGRTSYPKPLLIIANHRSLSDAWMVGASFPFGSSLLPFGYVAGSKFRGPLATFFRLGIVQFVYWVFGVVALPADGTLEEKIAPAVSVLKRGGSMVIFPEGKRVFEDRIGEFKKGASEIFLRARVPVLPVVQRKVLGAGFHKQRVVVAFGDVFTPKGNTAGEVTKELHRVVSTLYQSIRS